MFWLYAAITGNEMTFFNAYRDEKKMIADKEALENIGLQTSISVSVGDE